MEVESALFDDVACDNDTFAAWADIPFLLDRPKLLFFCSTRPMRKKEKVPQFNLRTIQIFFGPKSTRVQSRSVSQIWIGPQIKAARNFFAAGASVSIKN